MPQRCELERRNTPNWRCETDWTVFFLIFLKGCALGVADGDVCRLMTLPIYVMLPRLLVCPTVLNGVRRREFGRPAAVRSAVGVEDWPEFGWRRLRLEGGDLCRLGHDDGRSGRRRLAWIGSARSVGDGGIDGGESVVGGGDRLGDRREQTVATLVRPEQVSDQRRMGSAGLASAVGVDDREAGVGGDFSGMRSSSMGSNGEEEAPIAGAVGLRLAAVSMKSLSLLFLCVRF
ncbi:hypothetical protein M5K25_026945 [Dendrobium thyrsiflorum]|uniref:Uncharacterized protein n=1 Tax=Dendrobium thyrsiflorum TaxID=117978 RepID=A0ABD0TYS9_DENTH